MAEAQAVSLKDILSRYGLKNEDLDKEIPSTGDSIVLQIAKKIKDWETAGHYLGIPDEKLVAIKIDNRTEEQCRIKLLHIWMERECSRTTYLRLVTVLHQLDRNDLVKTVCTMLSTGIRKKIHEKQSTLVDMQKQGGHKQNTHKVSTESTTDSAQANSARSNKPKTGFNCKFTFDPMTCPICDTFLQDPQMVSCCNMNFCKYCIEQVKDRSRRCPMCSRGEFDYQPNEKLNKVLLQCNVNCTLECGWSGPLKRHDKHVNTKCSKAADLCVYCKKCCHPQRLHTTFHSSKVQTVYDLTCTEEVCSKWEAIGKELNISDDTLQNIRQFYLGIHDTGYMYRDMLEKWIESANNPNWKKLLTAFRRPTVTQNRFAAIIEQGLTCDTASEQQVIQMKEKAQKLLQEYSIVQGSRSRSRKYSRANVEDRMRSCLTMLINKAEELEFEENIKFQDQGLGKPDGLIPYYYHTMTQEGWLQTAATEVTRFMHAIDIRNMSITEMVFSGMETLTNGVRLGVALLTHRVWRSSDILPGSEEQKKRGRIIMTYMLLVKVCCDAIEAIRKHITD